MRELENFERPLIAYLFELASIPIDLDLLRVETMTDGGMGSMAMIPRAGRKYGSTAAACHFFDLDGVLVSAELYLDQKEEPFEIDILKMDSSPTTTWPERQQINAGPPK